MSSKTKEQKPVTAPKQKLRKPSKYIVEKPIIIPCRHDYTQEESLALGRELNQHFQKKRALESEKKAISADYSSQIKQQDSRVEAVGQKISNGYELRDTQCVVQYDFKARKKLYFRLDTDPHEFVKEEQMSESDLQEEFPFSVEKPKDQDVPPVPGKIVSVGEAMSEAERARADEAKSLKARKDLLESPEGEVD